MLDVFHADGEETEEINRNSDRRECDIGYE